MGISLFSQAPSYKRKIKEEMALSCSRGNVGCILGKITSLKARQKADYLFSLRQYGKAMDGYEKILEDAENKKAEDGFLGAIWYNLGACRARVFQFAGAMEAFDRAYGKLKSLSVLEAMYHVTRMDPSLTLKERYQSLVTEEQKAAWDADFEKAGEAAACSEAARRLEDLFGRDPIRRQEGIRQQVEEWKQEYRAMA